jgi:hypothetical protein
MKMVFLHTKMVVLHMKMVFSYNKNNRVRKMRLQKSFFSYKNSRAIKKIRQWQLAVCQLVVATGSGNWQ